MTFKKIIPIYVLGCSIAYLYEVRREVPKVKIKMCVSDFINIKAPK